VSITTVYNRTKQLRGGRYQLRNEGSSTKSDESRTALHVLCVLTNCRGTSINEYIPNSLEPAKNFNVREERESRRKPHAIGLPCVIWCMEIPFKFKSLKAIENVGFFLSNQASEKACYG
jgi:hypothetical protein